MEENYDPHLSENLQKRYVGVLRPMTEDEFLEDIAKAERQIAVLEKRISDRQSSIDTLQNGMAQYIKMMSEETVQQIKDEIQRFAFEQSTLRSRLEDVKSKFEERFPKK